MVNSGYSGCTLRITYRATVKPNGSVITGDAGNPNSVVLTWKRSNTSYYDTLEDDCRLYTYGLDITKRFSDGKGDPSKVEFIARNDTDGYFLKGELNQSEGVYYITDHVAAESEATHFTPTKEGKLLIKGVEDDSYTLTEVKTDRAYTLLKNSVQVVIQSTQLGPKSLSATATVDRHGVNMGQDGSSANALVPFTIINTRGFDLPQTGSYGNWMFPVVGLSLLAVCIAGIVILCKKTLGKEGVGHLLGSSLPVGGLGTHCVLTGHSGLSGQKMFSDLDQLETGDVFYLKTLDETLAYMVLDINKVLPEDTSQLSIDPARDSVTLVTCTPYGVNTHRLLVRGERIELPTAQQMVEQAEFQEVPAASTWTSEYLRGLGYGCLGIIDLAALAAIFFLPRRCAKKKVAPKPKVEKQPRQYRIILPRKRRGKHEK